MYPVIGAFSGVLICLFYWCKRRWKKKKGTNALPMEITIIFKIALVGILVTILNQILKQSGRDEQAFIVSLAGLLLVLFWIIPYISELFTSVEDMFSL